MERGAGEVSDEPEKPKAPKPEEQPLHSDPVAADAIARTLSRWRYERANRAPLGRA